MTFIRDEERVVEEKIKDAWTANKWRVIAIALAVVVVLLAVRACQH